MPWVGFVVLVATVTAPVPGGAAAADTSRIVDFTETIALQIPDDWADLDGTPTTSDIGEPRGQIFATPDRFELQTTGRVPWVWATVIPAPADPATWLANNTAFRRCVLGESETFDNGDVLGTRVSWRGCGGRTGRLVQVAGRSKSNDATAVAVQMFLPRADDALADQILDSIEVLPRSNQVEAEPGGNDSVVLAGEPVAAFVIDAVPADSDRIVDDTHGLAVSVPPDFDDTYTFNEFNDDGSRRPMIVAAPNLSDFLIDGDSGVLVTRLPHVDPAVVLTNTAFPFCTDTGFRTISNGSYKGLVQMWVQCDGPMDRIATVALTPPDESATVYLQVALPDDDLSALQIAIASVELL